MELATSALFQPSLFDDRYSTIAMRTSKGEMSPSNSMPVTLYCAPTAFPWHSSIHVAERSKLPTVTQSGICLALKMLGVLPHDQDHLTEPLDALSA